MNHTFIVSNRGIKASDGLWTVQNGVKSDTLTLELDEEFSALETVLVTLYGPSIDEPVVIEWDGEPVEVPARALERAGLLYASVTGYSGDKRIVTKAMGLDNAIQVIPSGEIAIQPTDEVTTPDVSSHIASLEARASRLESIIDGLLGIDVSSEATDEERQHLARVMYDMANGAVKGVRATPVIISRAGLDDMDALEFEYLYPEYKAGRAYKVGDVLRLGEQLIEMSKAVASAPKAPEAGSYRVIGQDPAPSWDEWRQPFGAHDAYSKGYIVIDPTDGKAYKSTVDGNCYGPPSQYPTCWEIYK